MRFTPRNLLIFIFLSILITSFASAQVQTLGTVAVNEEVNLVQGCTDSTYSNISYITYNNLSYVLPPGEYSMTEGANDYYNYTFSSTSVLGEYLVYGHCDELGTNTLWVYNFFVTSTGNKSDVTQSVIIFSQFGIILLFLVLGFTFDKTRWKLKSFFFMMALLMGVVFLNSIRIILGSSGVLNTMGVIGLVIGITSVSFMFLYVLINYTIEIFNAFKSKDQQKWSLNDYRN